MNIGHETGKGQNSGLSLRHPDGQPDWSQIEQIEWVQPLKECMQEPEFHAEGDVYTHTKMVVEELLQLPEYKSFTKEIQNNLFYAALFHDIAKPKCTVTENGVIRSPRHALVGEKMAREILWDNDFAQRELICSLVRLHGLPIWLLEKNNSLNKAVAASLRLDNRLLYALAKADMLGRICKDQDEMLMRVELYKEYCAEHECLDTPKSFYNTHSRFKFFHTKAEYPADLYDDTQFEVVIMSGIAGSGKDTYAAKLDLPIVSLDDLRTQHRVKHGDKKGQGKIIQLAYEQAKEYCRKQQSFIWNSTNLTTDIRSKLIRTLAPYKPKFKIVYVETSVTNLFQRRRGEIQDAAIYRMMRMLDMPQLNEAHEVEYLRN